MSKPSLTLPPSCGLFSSRDTLEEALAYANELILSSVPAGAPRQAALAALHVTSNTAIKLLENFIVKEPGKTTQLSDMTDGERIYVLKFGEKALVDSMLELLFTSPKHAIALSVLLSVIEKFAPELSIDHSKKGN